jgi:hypothetical protein
VEEKLLPDNVRVLTRSPRVSPGFDLFKAFGPRLTSGMNVSILRKDPVGQLEEFSLKPPWS